MAFVAPRYPDIREHTRVELERLGAELESKLTKAVIDRASPWTLAAFSPPVASTSSAERARRVAHAIAAELLRPNHSQLTRRAVERCGAWLWGSLHGCSITSAEHRLADMKRLRSNAQDTQNAYTRFVRGFRSRLLGVAGSAEVVAGKLLDDAARAAHEYKRARDWSRRVEKGSAKLDARRRRRAFQELARVLDDWTVNDIARLIIVSEDDWITPPCSDLAQEFLVDEDDDPAMRLASRLRQWLREPAVSTL